MAMSMGSIILMQCRALLTRTLSYRLWMENTSFPTLYTVIPARLLYAIVLAVVFLHLVVFVRFLLILFYSLIISIFFLILGALR